MASILLSGIGSAVGGMIAGPLGAKLGASLGMALGGAVNNALYGGNNYQITGSRLSDLSVQTSTYGKSIPVLFGQTRFAGNVIWSLPIKEHENRVEASGGKGGGRRSSVTSVTYTYTVTLAIALCEGEIDAIINIWADAKNITHEIDNFRIYKGSEDQMPDPIIEAHEGIDKTPAYRGLAYIVIEDFPLFDYGNRIPNFTFEAKRRARNLCNTKEISVEDRLKAVCIIPGSGEFVYDTHLQYKSNSDRVAGVQIQNGKSRAINMNNFYNKADALVSLDQLENTCKNIEWAAPVVGWFGDSLDISKCVIRPGVEFKENVYTEPDLWRVSDIGRESAYQITLKDGSPIYGGTVSDISIIRYLEELSRRELKIMFYPMLFVDALDKPWRGHMSGEAKDVERFFRKKGGYNEFILHYARLVVGKVDAFIIGSEIKNITSIRNVDGKFVAVECLINLAREVKEILGNETKITYAADWSEYHHSEGGWRGLDDLWASDYIDFIGIDAYFPLTENAKKTLTEEEVIKGWDSGECYDFYFHEENGKRLKRGVSSDYALKNIKYWWENYHYNPDGSKTKWIPKSKKIWFTEFGFPSVDGATNQPNIFFDPEAFDGGLPIHSKGDIDFYGQRVAIESTLKRWEDSEMVENLFLWTWDARPYPHYPVLKDVWGDGLKWDKGHWVNGKFGLSSLSNILSEICVRSGMDVECIKFHQVVDIVDGFVLDEVMSARNVVALLSQFYFFDMIEESGGIKFIAAKSVQTQKVNHLDLIYNSNKDLFNIVRKEEQNMPSKVELLYSDKNLNYHQNVARSENHYTTSLNSVFIGGNIVLNPKIAIEKSSIIMSRYWNSRNSYKFLLPFQYSYLKPSDLILLKFEGRDYKLKISNITLVTDKCLEIEGSSEDLSIYSHIYDPCIQYESRNIESVKVEYVSYILDIPSPMGADTNKSLIYVAAAAKSGEFHPVSIYGVENKIYNHIGVIMEESIIGCVHEALANNSHPEFFDLESEVRVTLISGELSSVTEEEILNGANMAMIGDEIVQFRDARLIAENQYILSCFLRGRRATERLVNSHKDAEKFIFLDESIKEIELSKMRLGSILKYKLSGDSESLDDVEEEQFLFSGNSIKPLSPVHIVHKNISKDSFEISWTRRSRMDSGLRHYVDVPVGEVTEQYEVEFFEGETPIETVVTNKPSAICDVNLLARSSKVHIYQVSEVVGRGVPALYDILYIL